MTPENISNEAKPEEVFPLEVEIEEDEADFSNTRENQSLGEADRARGRDGHFSEELQLAAEKAAEALIQKERDKEEAARIIQKIKNDETVN